MSDIIFKLLTPVWVLFGIAMMGSPFVAVYKACAFYRKRKKRDALISLASLILVVALVPLMHMPIGPTIAVEKTKWQEFNWGSMYVWTSRDRVAETPSGYDDILILEFSFNKTVMDKGCNLAVNRVHLRDPNADVVLIDEFGSPLLSVELVGHYRRIQKRLPYYVFELMRSDLPYDLNIELGFDCEGKQEAYTFSQPLEIIMVQAVLKNQ